MAGNEINSISTPLPPMRSASIPMTVNRLSPIGRELNRSSIFLDPFTGRTMSQDQQRQNNNQDPNDRIFNNINPNSIPFADESYLSPSITNNSTNPFNPSRSTTIIHGNVFDECELLRQGYIFLEYLDADGCVVYPFKEGTKHSRNPETHPTDFPYDIGDDIYPRYGQDSLSSWWNWVTEMEGYPKERKEHETHYNEFIIENGR
jgi:hypothetical protein